MAKRATPKTGVRYTFRFMKNGEKKLSVLEYVGINAEGRLEFYNVKTGTFTSMPEKRFSYIHRFNLLKEEPSTKRTIKMREVPPAQIEDTSPKIEVKEDCNKIIQRLETLSEKQREIASIKLNRSYDAFLSDFINVARKPESSFDPISDGAIMAEMISVLGVLGIKVAKI